MPQSVPNYALRLWQNGKMPGLTREANHMAIFRDKAKKQQKIEFSYPPSDALAQMIVEASSD
jgi:hypothetical protein